MRLSSPSPGALPRPRAGLSTSEFAVRWAAGFPASIASVTVGLARATSAGGTGLRIEPAIAIAKVIAS